MYSHLSRVLGTLSQPGEARTGMALALRPRHGPAWAPRNTAASRTIAKRGQMMNSSTIVGWTRKHLAAALALTLLAAPAHAACITDGQGVDDQPGQKDVTRLCEGTSAGLTCSSSTTTLALRWQLDDLSWSGG